MRLSLVRQCKIERRTLAVVAVSVVEDRIGVDHVERSGANDLNLWLEAAFDVVEFWRLSGCWPVLSLRHFDQINDRTFDGLAVADPYQRLLARLSANLDILGRYDFFRRHAATIDNRALDRSAALYRRHFIGQRRDIEHGCAADHKQSGQENWHSHRGAPPAVFGQSIDHI